MPDPLALIVASGDHVPDILRYRAGAIDQHRDNDRLPGLEARLLATMREHKGDGIAAPQVGVPLRLVLVQRTAELCVMRNPSIVRYAADWVAGEEGCLSLPGESWLVNRALRVEADWWDENWAYQREWLFGATARCFQHECDHLDGRLIRDIGSRPGLFAPTPLSEPFTQITPG